jgi:hypothetical protein
METAVVSFTPEQFDKLMGAIAAVKGGDAAPAVPDAVVVRPGFGGIIDEKATQQAGLGAGTCLDLGLGPLSADVYTFLQAGYPRLALAKAMGIPLAPWTVNIRATFTDTSVSAVTDVGSDSKIMTDTIVDSMVFRISNQSTVANQNAYQVQSDFFFGFQSSMEATLDVTGAPRYAVAPKYTPLSNLMDAFNGDARRGAGWVLVFNEALKMSFNAKVTLPYAPIEVVCTFNCRVPVWDELVQMTNREAIRRLVEDCGLFLTDSYVKRCCR